MQGRFFFQLFTTSSLECKVVQCTHTLTTVVIEGYAICTALHSYLNNSIHCKVCNVPCLEGECMKSDNLSDVPAGCWPGNYQPLSA